MFRVIKSGTIEGNSVNEDKIYKTNDFVIFLDGASGLEKNLIPNAKSDAKWYVDKFTKYFTQYYDDYVYKKYAIRKTIHQIHEDYHKLVPNNQINNVNTPSASGIVITESKDKIHGYYTGDVKTAIIRKSGKTSIYFDKPLTKLDHHVFSEANKQKMNKGTTFRESISTMSELVKYNRSLKNKENGYYIFSTDVDMIKNIKTFNVPKSELDYILIMSDGFYGKFDKLNIPNIIQTINKTPKKSILQNIKQEFQEDKDFEKYNRFKLVDDISFSLIKIQ
jgi:serine/threonine protein phosphatase PrpC